MSTWWELRPHQLSFPRFYLVLHVLARPALLVYSESPDLLHAVVVALLAPPRFTPCTMWWTRNSGAF